jgi:hypothetical protein
MVAPLTTAAFFVGGVAPAHAATPLNLITTASASTSVGYTVFANLNLMGAGATPTGTATFRLYEPGDTGCWSSIFTSSVAVTSTSVNSARFATNQAGVYRWTTSYSGDANYSPGTTLCTSDSADVTVARMRNSLRVTAQPIIGGAMVAAASLTGYNPTGTITFYLTGPDNSFCSGAPIYASTASVAFAGSYVSASFAPSVAGTYTWRATYSGDSDNQGTSMTACMSSGNTVTFTD